jgi:glycosyltransferase involved in cell wall biosynthesis
MAVGEVNVFVIHLNLLQKLNISKIKYLKVMKIAQIAPLWERVPPPAYGGIELVVALLTDELVARGHDVTLFASGDSITSAKLASVYDRALRLDPDIREYEIYDMLNLGKVYAKAEEFDIIHSHIGCAALTYAKLCKQTPTVHTLHGIFTRDNSKLYSYAKDQPYISISNSQREPSLDLNCVATVYNSIRVSDHHFFPQPDAPAYLAFLGRMSHEKGPQQAIEIAKRVGIPLKMAGKIDPVDKAFFTEHIAPHIDGEFIQFLGEANHTQKNNLMGKALATLFPITWREPFGLVMIESMAAGTPVIGINMGSVSEVIADGTSGFVCQDLDECVAAVAKIDSIDRQNCRDYVSHKFGVQVMTDGYEAVYRQVLGDKWSSNGCMKIPALLVTK